MLPFNPFIERAIELASEWHDGTYRKGRWRPALFALPGDAPVRVPAMAHLTAVALTVQRAGFDDETVAAAFLHDSIEDANRAGERLRREVLEREMGPRVTALVLAVTEPKFDAQGRNLRWQDRKDGYLDTVRAAPLEAAAISLADKLHNLWTTNESLAVGIDVFSNGPDRVGLTGGPGRQRWFYQSVLEATAHHDDARLDPLRDALAGEQARFDGLVGPSAVP